MTLPSGVGANCEPGQALGPYLIDRLLGSGAFADVYLARHRLLDQLVALKVVRTPDAEGWEQEGARLMCRLRHPNIVSVQFADRIDGHLVIAMDYVDGRTLQDVLGADGVLAADEAVRIARAVCDALAYLHGFQGRGFAHLDLKPSNILIDRDGQVRLTDFGLAGLFAAERQGPARVAGSPAYMAPEQFDGAGDARSDLWAVGVLLFEMLTGEPPFSGGSFDDYRAAVLAGTTLRWPQRAPVPDELRAVVERCLQQDPSARFGSARELAQALDASATAGERLCPHCHAPLPEGTDRCVDCTFAETEGATGRLPAPGRGQPAATGFGAERGWRPGATDALRRRRTETLARNRGRIWAVAVAVVLLATLGLGGYEAVRANWLGTSASRDWQRVLDVEQRQAGGYGDRIAALEAFIDAHPASAEIPDASDRLERWREEARLFEEAQSYEKAPGLRMSEALRRWQAFLAAERSGLKQAHARARFKAWERELAAYAGPAELRIIGATGVPASDLDLLGHEQADTYFVLFRNVDPVYRSLTIRDSPAPVWNETVRIVIEPGARVAIELRDRDPLNDETLFRQDLGALPPDGPFEVAHGTVQIRMAITRER